MPAPPPPGSKDRIGSGGHIHTLIPAELVAIVFSVACAIVLVWSALRLFS